MTDLNAPPTATADWLPTFWGSVNTWECDENDHQNVRFYAHKMNQAIQAWIAERTGVWTLTGQVLAKIRGQHIRFLREARAATPLRIECQQLHLKDDRLTVATIMYHNATHTPLAAFQTELDISEWSAIWHDQTRREPPEHARPRGLEAQLPTPPANRAAAEAAGFQVVGRGVIGNDECDPAGTVLPHVYIGRVSDGMPNLWVFVNTEEDASARSEGAMGGAALEYRLGIHEPLRCGDIYTHLSGVRAIGAKTQTMAHVIINERTGRCAASAAAIGVAMDLRTRRAVEIPPARRARLEKLLLRED